MPTAVLLTCHGTVDRIEDLPAFLANIRRGRPTPPAVLAEVAHRFTRIGGSPLMRTTAAQAAALALRLSLPVRIAGRLWGPYPAEVVAELVREGVTTLISLPLAPQSVEIYHAPVREAAAAHAEAGSTMGLRPAEPGSAPYPGLELRCAPPWGLEPALVDAFVESIDEALARFPDDERAGVAVILSAHSLPRRVIDAGDLYEQQFRAMAAAVEARLSSHRDRIAPPADPPARPVRVAFQSQGMDGGDWLGPDLPATFAALAAGGARSALVAPIGFVSDHVETLYDLDIEAPILAAKAGLTRLERAPALNTRPRFIDALEAVVKRML